MRVAAFSFSRVAAEALLACAVSTAFALISPRSARAFCRTITQETPAGYDPAVSGCYPGNGASAYQVYWKNLCVSYSLQRDATQQIPLADVKAVAAEAFAAWSRVTCSSGTAPTITATELEPPSEDGVSCSEVQYNTYGPNQNVIVFRDQGWPNPGDSVNTLGLTTVTFDATNGEIFDADMELNSHDFKLVAFPPAPPNGYDLLTVMTHEAGHFLGLAHSADTTAMMYAFYHPGIGGALQADDVNGICSIDLADGARATSGGTVAGDACCPVPRRGLAAVCAPEDAIGNVVPPPAATPAAPIVAPCGGEAGSADGGAPTVDPSSPRGGGCSLVADAETSHAHGDARVLALFGLGWAGRRRRRACAGANVT